MEKNKDLKKSEIKIEKKHIILSVVLVLALGVMVALGLIFGKREKAYTEPYYRDFFGYFNTVSRISDYSGDEKQFEEIELLAEEIIIKYHRLFDIYNEYNDIVNVATLNRTAKEGEVSVSQELFDFLDFSKQMHVLTGGEVNIAMGAVLSVWHEYREEGEELPPMELLAEKAQHCDINDLILDEENLTVRFADPQMSLDVGAIAKGYAAEILAKIILEKGYTSVTIDLGGNLRAVGAKPNGDGWVTGVSNPYVAGGDYIHTLTLVDSSVVTSGNYERYYEVDGVKYHHVIDKDTLMPATHFASVTVHTENSALADALSTALFNMTYDEGFDLVKTLENVTVIWALHDGTILKNR